MTSIETIICLILLFVGVPDLCRKVFKRPALIYSVFVIFGLGLAPFVNEHTEIMLRQAGKVGFLLLLFEVGLEIELPKLREFIRPLKFAAIWAALQYPMILALAHLTGLTMGESLFAAAAFTGCSVGMAYHAWKNYDGFSAPDRVQVLQTMVLLETIAIVILSVETVTLSRGFGWMALVKFLGIALVIWLVSRFATRVQDVCQMIIAKATHWRVHLVTLLVLAVCAVGERLGLSSTKTAFFLGLFMSRTHHEGTKLEDYMAPISQRLLIPIFFVALGLQIDWRLLFSKIGVMAVCSAFLIIGLRQALQRRLMKTGGDQKSFLLFCPNLTMAALAADALLKNGNAPEVAAWVLLTGLFITVPAILMLPAVTPETPDRDTKDKREQVPAETNETLAHSA